METQSTQPAQTQAQMGANGAVESVGNLIRLWKEAQDNYRDYFCKFLDEFRDQSEETSLSTKPYYHVKALSNIRKGHTTLEVNLQHLRQWDLEQPALTGVTHFVSLNALYLVTEGHLHEVATKLVREVIETIPEDESQEWAEFFQNNVKLFNIALVDWKKVPLTLREVYCDKASQLSTITGTVTRTSEARPELRSAYFACELCKLTNGPVLQQFKFTEPNLCEQPGCHNKRRWKRIEEQSHYEDWQKIRLQENANEIPAGCLPRSMDIIMRGHLTNKCKAGDRLTASGCLAVVPDVASVMAKGDIPKLVLRDMVAAGRQEMDASANLRGVAGLGVRDLSCKTTFIVTGVRVENETDKDKDTAWNDDDDEMHGKLRGVDSPEFKLLKPALRRYFQEVAANPNCLDILAKHFLPRIYGCWNVKKGILLMLVGGVEKRGEKDDMKLRGDININIIGDPGTAKSAILRSIVDFVPRSVYASGKMATAAGLTASVQRDREQNGSPVIEAGALMLADGGVCCIDEFDRMDPKDMSSIHEAMEQQTISISKAGVQATLNARASVVAACNPIHGKYDPSKTFRQNVNLTAPILSRFDLMFVIMDDNGMDAAVAAHILGLNPDEFGVDEGLETDHARMNEDKLHEYIRIARTLKPKLTSAAMSQLVRSYVVLRQQDVIPGAQRHTRMTVRQLESLIRLSEATAKLHFSEEVHPKHVQVAFDLFQSALTKVSKGTIDFAPDEPTEGEDNSVPHVTSVDGNIYRLCANAIITHMLGLKRQRVASGDHTECRISEEELIDWIVEGHLPSGGDESDLVRNYELAGKIVKQMAEIDQTLQTDTMLEDDENEVVMISLHPTVSATGTTEYTDMDADLRATNARRNARGAHVPSVEVVEDEDEEDFFATDRFDEYMDRLNQE